MTVTEAVFEAREKNLNEEEAIRYLMDKTDCPRALAEDAVALEFGGEGDVVENGKG